MKKKLILHSNNAINIAAIISKLVSLSKCTNKLMQLNDKVAMCHTLNRTTSPVVV